jgi:hypothetical protein
MAVPTRIRARAVSACAGQALGSALRRPLGLARPLQAGGVRVGNLYELAVLQSERGAMSSTAAGAAVQRLELDQDAAINDVLEIGPHGVEEAATDVLRGHRSERFAIEQVGDEILNMLLAVCLIRHQDRGVLQAIAVEVSERRDVCLKLTAIQFLDAAQRLLNYTVEKRSAGMGRYCWRRAA